MRALTVFALALLASPAFAQSDRDAARTVMVEDASARGLPAPVAEAIVPCFLDLMTDAQVAAVIAAETTDARDAVFNGMDNIDEATDCMTSAMAALQ